MRGLRNQPQIGRHRIFWLMSGCLPMIRKSRLLVERRLRNGIERRDQRIDLGRPRSLRGYDHSIATGFYRALRSAKASFCAPRCGRSHSAFSGVLNDGPTSGCYRPAFTIGVLLVQSPVNQVHRRGAKPSMQIIPYDGLANRRLRPARLLRIDQNNPPHRLYRVELCIGGISAR